MCGPSEPLRCPLRHAPPAHGCGIMLTRNKTMVLCRSAGLSSFRLLGAFTIAHRAQRYYAFALYIFITERIAAIGSYQWLRSIYCPNTLIT